MPSIKRGKWERKHKAPSPDLLDPQGPGAIPPEEIPHEALTEAPSPIASSDMASGGEDIVRGNSNLQPLTPQGVQTAQGVGSAIASLGGPSKIIPSTSQRAQETAQALSQQTGVPASPGVPGLESHAMGALEGEPKTPQVRKFLADLVRKYPNFRIPGQGAQSSRASETFNEFRVRALSAVRGLMQTLAQNPQQSIAVPTHSQIINLVRAWVSAGLPDDLSINSKAMIAPDLAQPGDVERFFPDQEGSWSLEPFDLSKASSLPGGSIYFVRHGETASTQAKTQQVSDLQRSRARIISQVRAGDFHRARAEALKAQAAGLSDEEISSAIDEALPSAEEADSLPSSHLLSAFSAGSPQKRAELSGAVQRRFSQQALAQLPPVGQQALGQHLSRLTS